MSLFENLGAMAKGAPKADRMTMDKIAPGLGIVRRQIFSSPVTEEGWQFAMLRHMEVAKSLGCTMFEIDTAKGMRQRAKPASTESLYSMYFRTPGDEWKNKEMEEVETTVVTLFALVIE